jgi:hypothetical protein
MNLHQFRLLPSGGRDRRAGKLQDLLIVFTFANTVPGG